MKYIIEKDKKRRELFTKYEYKRLVYKSILNWECIDKQIRNFIQIKLSKHPKDSSPVRIRNRCIKTGRARGILSTFRISRIVFRDLGSKGEIPGLTKASW